MCCIRTQCAANSNKTVDHLNVWTQNIQTLTSLHFAKAGLSTHSAYLLAAWHVFFQLSYLIWSWCLLTLLQRLLGKWSTLQWLLGWFYFEFNEKSSLMLHAPKMIGFLSSNVYNWWKKWCHWNSHLFMQKIFKWHGWVTNKLKNRCIFNDYVWFLHQDIIVPWLKIRKKNLSRPTVWLTTYVRATLLWIAQNMLQRTHLSNFQ